MSSADLFSKGPESLTQSPTAPTTKHRKTSMRKDRVDIERNEENQTRNQINNHNDKTQTITQ